MTSDEIKGLQFAPIGASNADCAVCLRPTLLRLVIGDGVAPICCDDCLRAWPRVRKLLDAAEECERLRAELHSLRASYLTLEERCFARAATERADAAQADARVKALLRTERDVATARADAADRRVAELEAALGKALDLSSFGRSAVGVELMERLRAVLRGDGGGT